VFGTNGTNSSCFPPLASFTQTSGAAAVVRQLHYFQLIHHYSSLPPAFRLLPHELHHFIY
jgi:hypothetical protein